MYSLVVRKNIKYYFYVFSLYSYCKWVGIEYRNVVSSIYQLLHSEKYRNWSLQDIIYYTVQKKLKKKSIRKIQNTFFNLMEEQFTINEVVEILNVSEYAIGKVRKYGFSTKKAILLLYFCGDKFVNHKKDISKEKMLEIKRRIQNKNYGNDLATLFCFYYLGIDVEKELTDWIAKRFIITIYKHSFIKSITDDVPDILQEVNLILWELIKKNKICLNNSNQIATYMYKSVIFKIKFLLYKLQQERNQNHLEDSIYDNKCLGDFVYQKHEFDYLF